MLLLPLAAFILLAIETTVSPYPVVGVGFTVDSTLDAVDANPGDGACATNAGECTLRAAVQEANALPGPDAITLPAGTYQLTIPGRAEDAAVTGDLDITDDLTITGAGPDATMIDGNGLDTVLHVGEAGNAEISGVGIRGGNATTLEGGLHGGGILNEGVLTLRGSRVSENTAIAGGGIFNDGQATIEDVVIADNQAPVGGGGIGNDHLATIVIVRSSITGNRVELGDGGGISNYWIAQISDSTIALNEASQSGGGIENRSDASITNSTISGNTALRGGGIVNFGEPSPAIRALLQTPIHKLNLLNVTVAKNSAQGGSGIRNTGTVTASNAIIAGADGVATCDGVISSLGHNLSDDDSCGLNAAGDMQGVDPLLSTLADNGGPTQTHALLAGSPAIDAGDGSVCPPSDQRGEPRPVDGTDDGIPGCDIGAYEAPQGFVSTPTPSPTPAALPKTGRRP